jgi:hypothetical protein
MSAYDPNSTDSTLSRIETTLNGHVAESRSYREALDVKLSKHDVRISKLEESGWKATGAAGALGAVAGAAAAMAAKVWK